MFSNPGDVVEQHPHPFGNELAQVSELAEEFGGTVHIVDEEERELISRGLYKFDAEDYVNEIYGLFANAFGDIRKPAVAAMWI